MRLRQFASLALGAVGMHGLSDQDTKEQNPQRPRGKYRALTARRLARKNILQLARLVRRIGRGRRVGCTQGDIAALLRRRRVGLAAVTA